MSPEDGLYLSGKPGWSGYHHGGARSVLHARYGDLMQRAATRFDLLDEMGVAHDAATAAFGHERWWIERGL